jgi:hypothetical protein
MINTEEELREIDEMDDAATKFAGKKICCSSLLDSSYLGLS